MKKTLFALAALCAAAGVHAQTAPFLSNNSASTAQTQSQSAASNAGNAQAITFNSGDAPHNTRLNTIPSVAGNSFYGSFSPDSCMVSGGGGGSVVGFGINAAVPVEDKHCNLRRNFERVMQWSSTVADANLRRVGQQAGIDILCQSDEKTAAALSAAGLCSQQFATAQTRTASYQAPAAPATPVAASSSTVRTTVALSDKQINTLFYSGS